MLLGIFKTFLFFGTLWGLISLWNFVILSFSSKNLAKCKLIFQGPENPMFYMLSTASLGIWIIGFL